MLAKWASGVAFIAEIHILILPLATLSTFKSSLHITVCDHIEFLLSSNCQAQPLGFFHICAHTFISPSRPTSGYPRLLQTHNVSILATDQGPVEAQAPVVVV